MLNNNTLRLSEGGKVVMPTKLKYECKNGKIVILFNPKLKYECKNGKIKYPIK